MSSHIFPDSRAALKWTVQFLLPPAVVTTAWLFTRWGIQHSLWSLVPMFLVVSLGCAALCIILSVRFSLSLQPAASPGHSAFIRIAAACLWTVTDVTLAVGGLAVVEALPFRVGDGP